MAQETPIGTELNEKVKMRNAADQALNPAPAPAESPRTGSEPLPGADKPRKLIKGEVPIPRKDIEDWSRPLLSQKPVKKYDGGGRVNVNDGNHELAILQDGERVLTPEQNRKYEAKTMAKTAAGAAPRLDCYDNGGVVKTAAGADPKIACYDKGGVVHSTDEKSHFHRAMAHLNKGGLHRALGIPEDQDIPLAKKQAAANSENPHTAKMGAMATAMHGWAGQAGGKAKCYDKGGVVGEDADKGTPASPSTLPSPGTSTSTGGATAHRNTGAATGGAVTITTSGSSSTDTSTATGAGAKGSGKGEGNGKSPEKAHPLHITVNSMGKSGNAIDAKKGNI